jgi:hypothetical protein
MLCGCAERDEGTPIPLERGESVADALLRPRRGGMDGSSKFFKDGPLLGTRVCENFVNVSGFRGRHGMGVLFAFHSYDE